MKIRLVVGKPAEHWLSDKPAEDGYWGFVRCRADYEGEKATLLKEFGDLTKALKKEGRDVELIPGFLEIDGGMDIVNTLKAEGADVAIVFNLCGINQTAIVNASKNTIFFDKFRPNTYHGTLFNPPFYQKLRAEGKAKNVYLVEGDWEKLKSILRKIH